MDAIYIIREISKIKNRKSLDKEKFSVDNNDKIINYGQILSFIIGTYAAYLSYTCNTKENMDCGMKVIYAILAYIFGLLYLLYYFLFRNEQCSNL